jgi:hypothetical protein
VEPLIPSLKYLKHSKLKSFVGSNQKIKESNFRAMNKIITLSNEHTSEMLRVPIPFAYLRIETLDYHTPFHHPSLLCIWPVHGTRKRVVNLVNFSVNKSVPPPPITRSYNLLRMPPHYKDMISPMNMVIFKLNKQFMLDIDFVNITVQYGLFEYG